MFIGPLPEVLRNIQEDGRSNEEIIAALEVGYVSVFHKDIFTRDTELLPPAATVYQFLGVSCRELPKDLRRLGAERIFAAVTQEHGNLEKPSLRSALLLMERMAQKHLWADIVVMNEAVPCHDGSPVLICLGHEDEEGVPWVAAVGTDYDFPHDSELLLFLADPLAQAA